MVSPDSVEKPYKESVVISGDLVDRVSAFGMHSVEEYLSITGSC